MQRNVIVLCLALAADLPARVAAHPNDSMIRERIPPTPYGLRLTRGEDGWLRALPQAPASADVADHDIDASRAAYLAAIEQAELSRGAYAADLVEPLASVGRLSQAEQDHAQAMAFFQRALHLSRVNEGLYCTSQLPILQDMIRSQLAMGNLQEADELQRYRFRVQQHAYRDDEQAMLAAVEEYSEWEREFYLAGVGDDTYRRLLKMHTLQSEVIQTLEQQDNFQPTLISLLYQRVGSEYLLADYRGEKAPTVQISISRGGGALPPLSADLERQEFVMLKNNCFRSGLKTLEQILELEQNRQPPQADAVAQARVALGDWYLWWDMRARALQNYQEAWEILAGDGNATTSPEELFTEPVELPADPVFRPSFTTNTDRSPARAVVSMTVSRLGKAQNIEILELDADDTMGARVTLYKMLGDVRFRPLVVDGDVVASQSVVREYRFDY